MTVFALYTDNDNWASLQDDEELNRYMSMSTSSISGVVVVEPGLTHGFTMDKYTMIRACAVISQQMSSQRFVQASAAVAGIGAETSATTTSANDLLTISNIPVDFETI